MEIANRALSGSKAVSCHDGREQCDTSTTTDEEGDAVYIFWEEMTNEGFRYSTAGTVLGIRDDDIDVGFGKAHHRR